MIGQKLTSTEVFLDLSEIEGSHRLPDLINLFMVVASAQGLTRLEKRVLHLILQRDKLVK